MAEGSSWAGSPGATRDPTFQSVTSTTQGRRACQAPRPLNLCPWCFLSSLETSFVIMTTAPVIIGFLLRAEKRYIIIHFHVSTGWMRPRQAAQTDNQTAQQDLGGGEGVVVVLGSERTEWEGLHGLWLRRTGAHALHARFCPLSSMEKSWGPLACPPLVEAQAPLWPGLHVHWPYIARHSLVSLGSLCLWKLQLSLRDISSYDKVALSI